MSRFDAEKASTATLNVKIQEALDRPMPMPLAKPISLEAVVNYIKDATRSPNGEAIPIYVDPIGLAESDHQMSSTISQVDLEGVPLRSELAPLLETAPARLFRPRRRIVDHVGRILV